MNGGTFAGCPTGAQYAIQVIDMGADGTYQMSPTKTVYYDTLDREIDADTQSFSGGLSRVTKTYNTQLQLASVTRPYVPGATPATTTYAYDALNRVTRTNYPDSSWDTIQYPATSKSITSGITSSYAGQNIWKTYDGRGNLTQSIQGVTESGKFTYIFSEYLYDGFNNLTRYTDPAGNLTKYGYDLLGRKTGITDPDAGTRTQSYGAFGDLLTVLDGKNNLATMTYDLLSRMTLRCWTNGNPGDAQTCPHPSATEIKEAWSYDPANGVGEIAGETSSSGTGYSAAHTYNGKSPTLGLLGQPATSTITINSTIFSYSYGYDDNNRPFYYFAPSGALPITQHNTYGYVSSLVDGYGGPTVWTANTRDAEGHLTSATFKNGITAIFAFDPKTGRETSFANQAPQGGSTITLQQALYQWDQLGNLLNRNDAINALNETYGYDELDRLTSITLPNNVSESTFSYDVLGNMLTNGGSTYTYPPAGSAQPHGVSSMQTVFGSIGFAYDLDGNVATETGAAVRTLVFTPFNMPQSVNNGGSGGKTITFQYDADHNRVMQSAPEGTTYYLPDGEQTPGAVWHTYFQMDGQRIAEDYGVTGALKHHYFHNDDQNTIGLVTDDTFNVANFPNGAWNVQNEGAAPFGQPRAANGGADWTWGAGDVTRRRWINQEDLADVQLIDLNARLYDPSIGKFYSPDPIISDQDDSQSWNAYSYAQNNPMSDDDSSGLGPCPPGALCMTTGFSPSPSVTVNGPGGGVNSIPSGELQHLPPQQVKDQSDASSQNIAPNSFGGPSIGFAHTDTHRSVSAQFATRPQISSESWFDRNVGNHLVDIPILPFAAVGAVDGLIRESLGIGLPELTVPGAGEEEFALQIAVKIETKAEQKLLSAPLLEQHHIFPQQFRKFFVSRGINIEDYTVTLGRTTHLKGVHGSGLGRMPGRWNQAWQGFIEANPEATAIDIYQFGGKAMDEFGLSGYPIRSYGK